MERRARIMATLGPASSSGAVIARMLDAGLDVVRLNLSHGTHDEHRALIREVRARAEERSRFIPIVLDLMGPRYRLGEIPGGERRLEEGGTVLLGAAEAAGAGLPVGNPDLLRYLRPGERVLLDNGLIELEVEACEDRAVTARVVQGGRVASRKGINLPDTELPFEISAKDREDAAFAVAEDVDYLAASYVHRAADLEGLQEVVADAGGRLPLIAKLERQGSIERLDELVDAADAVMVARGDLGVEVPLHRVPILQKEIVAAGRQRGKPVIVATQMLESMMEQPRPTRAEASDVANAVLDGADALMLSGETAAGRHPVAAVEVMDRIVLEAEAYGRRSAEEGPGGAFFPVFQEEAAEEADAWARTSDQASKRNAADARRGHRRPEAVGPAREERATEAYSPVRRGDRASATPEMRVDAALEPEAGQKFGLRIAEVVSAAAVHAAGRLPVRRIVAFSQGGFTARMIARNRPDAPILVFTTDPAVARRIQLVWGVRPLLMEAEADHHDEVVELVERQLLATRLAEPGESIVILMGDPIRERPLTNLLRVHRLRGE